MLVGALLSLLKDVLVYVLRRDNGGPAAEEGMEAVMDAHGLFDLYRLDNGGPDVFGRFVL